MCFCLFIRPLAIHYNLFSILAASTSLKARSSLASICESIRGLQLTMLCQRLFLWMCEQPVRTSGYTYEMYVIDFYIYLSVGRLHQTVFFFNRATCPSGVEVRRRNYASPV